MTLKFRLSAFVCRYRP